MTVVVLTGQAGPEIEFVMNFLESMRWWSPLPRFVTFALWGTCFCLGGLLPVWAGDPPSISLQPQSQQVGAGSNVILRHRRRRPAAGLSVAQELDAAANQHAGRRSDPVH